jgi:hypothetical protein
MTYGYTIKSNKPPSPSRGFPLKSNSTKEPKLDCRASSWVPIVNSVLPWISKHISVAGPPLPEKGSRNVIYFEFEDYMTKPTTADNGRQ